MEQKEYWERHGRTFDDLYEKPTWFNRHFRHAMFLRTRMAGEEIAKKPGATVLDVGCGSGRNSILFIKQFGASRVLGVDIAQDMLRLAHDLARQHQVEDRCQFQQGDFLTAQLPEEIFDYSVSVGVMDYFRDPTPILARMRRMTRIAAIATFPGYAPIRMTLRKLRYQLRGCGVYCFSKSRIEQMYAQAGFAGCRVVRCTSAGWTGYGYVDAANPDIHIR